MRASGLVILACFSVPPEGIGGWAFKGKPRAQTGRSYPPERGKIDAESAESRKKMASVMCVLVFSPTRGYSFDEARWQFGARNL